MAVLVPCPVCTAQISSAATKCPHCEHPDPFGLEKANKRKAHVVWWALIIAMTLLLALALVPQAVQELNNLGQRR